MIKKTCYYHHCQILVKYDILSFDKWYVCLRERRQSKWVDGLPGSVFCKLVCL